MEHFRSSCTSILIGKAASADGSVIIGRNEDSRSSWPKTAVVHPAAHHDEAPMFKSKDTEVEFALPKDSLQYTATPEWTDKYGLFEEDGINSAGVAMSATESAYANARVQGFDPFVEHGIIEECMITVVLPYVKSAREGVRRLGQLIETHGTGEANGILFADHDEAWYMEVVSGHHWLAQRIPDDGYAVVANQLSIEAVDFDSPDFIVDAGLRTFAEENHLWRPGTPFSIRRIFGTDDPSDRIYNTPRVWDGHQLLSKQTAAAETPIDSDLPFIMRPDRPLQVEDAMRFLSRHYQDTPYDPAGRMPDAKLSHSFRPISVTATQESHVLQLRPNLPAAIANIHWLAMGVPSQSQYVPFFAGLTDTPANYKVGALPASLDSAYWQYKLTSVLVDAHPLRFDNLLGNTQDDVHAKLVALVAATDAKARTLTAADDLAQLATKATFSAAKTADEAWNKLRMKILEQSTALGKLTFKMDPNL
ncbi:C69 family dipeptidase [Lacticaseibacillus sharpeae]|uniref:Dipeptidase n=1 Tax=Lacticaseibacillus sharpeae JCM 1186 = DSM 20505 TaxID=1291052 RepID=A0A0R1ZLY6_9LACO|nr:C69 family dipeptidase [Lacticaseibacillus sharpeae]KRM56056.1 pepD5 protein [Lacticaseibacillus sharpeae JCM 1186 = DSM 20505]